jgi:pre-mRNA-splicing factor CWC22
MEVESPTPVRTVVESVVYRPTATQQPKRKRSASPPRSPPRRPRRMVPPSTLPDVDPERALERERQLQERLAQQEKEKEEKKPFDPKEEYERLLNARSGGVYVPPARLRALQAQFTDKNTKEYQRMAWEALKKSINGLINKVTTIFLSINLTMSRLIRPISR